MAYTKQVWTDRDVQYPNRYKDQNNNVYTFTRDEGTINEAGDLINSTRMNNIEDGIEDVDTRLTTAEGEIDNTQTYLQTGWFPSGETWTYASADDPTYTFTIAGDKTTKYSAGMRIKLTQTTVKYFIITKVEYSSPNTTITMYGGTDYDLANTAITEPYFSNVKAPYGFPTNPEKWSVITTNTTTSSQANPTGLTWYNLGGVYHWMPIGAWRLKYSVLGQTGLASDSSSNKTFRTTLSTTNNGATHPQFTVSFGVVGAYNRAQCMKENLLTLTSPTLFYLNTLADVTSSAIYNLNGDSTLIIEAVCAYL